jgi:hypothetical protein
MTVFCDVLVIVWLMSAKSSNFPNSQQPQQCSCCGMLYFKASQTCLQSLRVLCDFLSMMNIKICFFILFVFLASLTLHPFLSRPPLYLIFQQKLARGGKNRRRNCTALQEKQKINNYIFIIKLVVVS